MNDQNEDSKDDDHDIIYALRTAHQNQTQLNLMADQKANILVGTIVIFLTFLMTRYNISDLNDHWLILLLSSIILLEMVSLLLGIMVIKPRAKWSGHKLNINEMPNPLFFGFFTSFSEQNYIDFMQQKLTDNHSARELLLKDIYQIGQVLKRKFRLLKYAYNFSALGISLGLIAIGLKLFGE